MSATRFFGNIYESGQSSRAPDTVVADVAIRFFVCVRYSMRKEKREKISSLVCFDLRYLLYSFAMCYIFAFVLVIFFVFEIIPRMEAFDMNSKSVLNPNEL